MITITDNKQYKTSLAQREANKRYKKRNPIETRISRYRSTARTFVRNHATEEDMKELNRIYETENENAKIIY